MAAAVVVVVVFSRLGFSSFGITHLQYAAGLTFSVELNIFMFMPQGNCPLAPCDPVLVVLYNCTVIRKYSRM